ncbi:MAG: oxidoreductase, partial [Aeromicrobium sp.]|nr:oxidoreductase [Aeromicrobium sp.]
MRIFVTGASGWIGSAVVDELLGAGHDVIGLARSDTSAAAIEAKGADVLRGDLDDLDSLRAGAKDADAVVHLANKHDFDNLAVSNKAERGAVETIGDTLVGSDRPFVIASGAAGLAQGRAST